MKFTTSLKENHLFRRAYAKGKSAVAPSLVVYARRNGTRGNRLGLTASTKVGNAVTRNRIRRRLREIYRLHEGEFHAGFDVVVVARARAAESSYWALEEQFLRLTGKVGLRKRPREGQGS